MCYLVRNRKTDVIFTERDNIHNNFRRQGTQKNFHPLEQSQQKLQKHFFGIFDFDHKIFETSAITCKIITTETLTIKAKYNTRCHQSMFSIYCLM